MNNTCPFIEGFRQTVCPTEEEFRAAGFDAVDSLTEVSAELPSPDFEQLAIRWRCSSRTVRRMFAANVDIKDAVSVGNYLTSVRAPSEPMLDAVLDELQPD
jgi:hypothetical protein